MVFSLFWLHTIVLFIVASIWKRFRSRKEYEENEMEGTRQMRRCSEWKGERNECLYSFSLFLHLHNCYCCCFSCDSFDWIFFYVILIGLFAFAALSDLISVFQQELGRNAWILESIGPYYIYIDWTCVGGDTIWLARVLEEHFSSGSSNANPECPNVSWYMLVLQTIHNTLHCQVILVILIIKNHIVLTREMKLTSC